MKALLFTILSIFILNEAQSQGYTIRQDPSDPKRKIIDIKPAVRKAPMVTQRGNLLTAAVKRPELKYDSFRMVHPVSGKRLDPNKTMTIKFSETESRTMTVKEYYDQLNEMEKQLTAGGRSLRIPATLADLKPNFIPASYQQQPKMGFGFKSTSFKTNSSPSPSYNAKTGLPIQSKFITAGMGINTNTFNVVPWEPGLFIAESTSGQGQPEFPAKWVTQSRISPGRTVFPVIIGVPKGFEGLVKRIEWYVKTTPFDETLVEVSPAGVIMGNSIDNPQFTHGILGLDIIPNAMSSKYCYFLIDLGKNGAPPPAPKAYYIRTVAYDAAGDILKISPQVVAIYGGTAKELKVSWPETNTVPNFNYSYPPDASVPFGLYVRGNGFHTHKNRFWLNETDKTMTTDGFMFKAGVTLGLRYFNFMSIVDAAAPKSKELNIVSARFVAGSGKGIPEIDKGVKLSLDILDGFMKPEIDFAAQVPADATSIPINHTVKQPMDWEILSTRFFIGPVPFKITAKVGGEAGVELSGNVNTSTFDFNGSIRPYLKTFFTASGGVDAVIAYATLNAEVNPLLEIGMPVKFSSSGQALTFSNNIAGLNGRVYLAVGFYYPCPSLKKIVGFLSGDEDLPLCECRWEWNIFDWKGFNETFTYESK